jgi:hypothetical protein
MKGKEIKAFLLERNGATTKESGETGKDWRERNPTQRRRDGIPAASGQAGQVGVN